MRCPPVPPKYFRVGFLCVPCGFVSPRLLAGARLLLKTATACTYECERKQCARGHSSLTAYSYAYVHTPSLSENRNGASQNNQNISEVKCLDTSREQFRVFVHPKKRLRPQFRESPVCTCAVSRTVRGRGSIVCSAFWHVYLCG